TRRKSLSAPSRAGLCRQRPARKVSVRGSEAWQSPRGGQACHFRGQALLKPLASLLGPAPRCQQELLPVHWVGHAQAASDEGAVAQRQARSLRQLPDWDSYPPGTDTPDNLPGGEGTASSSPTGEL